MYNDEDGYGDDDQDDTDDDGDDGDDEEGVMMMAMIMLTMLMTMITMMMLMTMTMMMIAAGHRCSRFPIPGHPPSPLSPHLHHHVPSLFLLAPPPPPPPFAHPGPSSPSLSLIFIALPPLLLPAAAPHLPHYVSSRSSW